MTVKMLGHPALAHNMYKSRKLAVSERGRAPELYACAPSFDASQVGGTHGVCHALSQPDAFNTALPCVVVDNVLASLVESMVITSVMAAWVVAWVVESLVESVVESVVIASVMAAWVVIASVMAAWVVELVTA